MELRAAPRAPIALWCVWVWVSVWSAVHADVNDPSDPIVVQSLNPTGLRISVPDSPGTDLVIINANINRPISSKENGQISGTVLERRHGYWALETKNVSLRNGDVVFTTAHIAHGNKGHTIGGFQIVHERVDPNCLPSPTTVNGKPVCAGELIFNENFDKLDSSIWKHFIQFSDERDFDFTTYTNDPKNSFVKDGSLHIKATVLEADDLWKHTKLDGCTWTRNGNEYCERKPVGWDILPPTRSAWLTTKGAFSFKFGRVEMRAKAAVGDWLFSRIQMEPETYAYGGSPLESGRVEILRVAGNADLLENGGLHMGAFLNYWHVSIKTCGRELYILQKCELRQGQLFSDDWHVFTVTWTPHSMVIKDDKGCDLEMKPPRGSFLQHDHFKGACRDSPWERGTQFVPFDQEFNFMISLMPGGFSVYDHDIKSTDYRKPWQDFDPKAMLNFWKSREKWNPTWKSDMEVDYIKVWSL